jgi:two-component system CheB/CheR fusion protein
LAIVSHDLRSPLSGIIGTAEYLKANLNRLEPHVVKEMLDLLHKTAVDELNMLEFSRMGSSKVCFRSFSPTKIAPFQYVQRFLNPLKISIVK